MKQYRLLLRERNFLKFITSINLIYLAQSIVDVTIIWLVYEKTQQPLFIAICIYHLGTISSFCAFLRNFDG